MWETPKRTTLSDHLRWAERNALSWAQDMDAAPTPAGRLQGAAFAGDGLVDRGA
jgi:hypothetical protein